MEQQNKLKESTIRFFHDLFDLLVVNCLWLLCCLPVITIGPAACGMYTVTLKLAREEPVNPLKDFLRGMKRNFKAGVLLELIVAVLLAFTAGDLWFAQLQTGWLQTLYLVLGLVTGMACMVIIGYAFPLQAMFEAPLKRQLLNALKLTAVAPGKTILIWVILLIPVIAGLSIQLEILKLVGVLYLIVGFSGPAYGASRILRNIFDRVSGASGEAVELNPEK